MNAPTKSTDGGKPGTKSPLRKVAVVVAVIVSLVIFGKCSSAAELDSISALTSCGELSIIVDVAVADYGTAFDAGDQSAVDHASAVADTAVARMTELGCS